MDDDFSNKDLQTLYSAEQTCHFMAVLCTEPVTRRTYEARLSVLRDEIERRQSSRPKSRRSRNAVDFEE